MNDPQPFSPRPGPEPGPSSLGELEARFARDLEVLGVPPTKEWRAARTHPRLGPVLDTAVIGAGMAGLAAAFALKRLGLRAVRVFDRSPEGVEGPWATYARMETLRSPKDLTGPALGFANLTFRAWFEAQFGRPAWEALYRIPRLQWMDYLRWYRRMIDMPIDNDTELVGLDGDAGVVLLTLRSATGEWRVAARRVVLANGRDGLGGPYVPELFRELPRPLWAHTSDDIDFTALRGKTVAVIGAGASAVDNAAEALEAGAGRVAMLVRRADIPRINKGMGISSPGLWHGFSRLTLEQRWSIVQYIADQAIPPPHASMLRCSRHPNFSVVTNCAISAAAAQGGRVVLHTTRGRLGFDFLIVATGFDVDWTRRPELARLAENVLLWGDRFSPDGRAFAQAADPFLGPDLQFLERAPGTAPWVERVHCFSFPAFMSHGPITGDIPGISVGAERIANAIAASLFAEDYDDTWRRLQAWNTPELLGNEWVEEDDLGPFRVAPAKADP